MNDLRQITPLILPNVERGDPEGTPPEMRWVAPTELFVDPAYQRHLSKRSIDLITRIVGRWNWRAFTPPRCVEIDGALHVVDGQHTAIAAATIGLPQIPIAVIDAVRVEDRAAAFVCINSDRVVMTALALHHAQLAAGDDEAIDLDNACRRTGVTLVRQELSRQWAVGETNAIGTMQSILRRRHVLGLCRVLRVCVAGRLAPIGAVHLRAIDLLMFAPEHKDLTEDALGSALREGADTIDQAARLFAHAHKTQIWRATAAEIARRARRYGRRAAA
jgi:hypothetical protein